MRLPIRNPFGSNDGDRIKEILNDTRLIKLALKIIDEKDDKIMALVDDVLTDVTEQSTVVDSVVTLLGSLKGQLDNAGTDPVKLQAIKDQLDTNSAALANAVVANTK